VPNFIIISVEMWAYGPKVVKIGIFGKNLLHVKIMGYIEKHEYRCPTGNLSVYKDPKIILKITLLNSTAMFTSYLLSSKCAKQTENIKYIFFV